MFALSTVQLIHPRLAWVQTNEYMNERMDE